MYYDHADLTRNFDVGTLQRGEDVARKGKVRMARRDDDRLVGEVSGSGNELYRQTIRFRTERGGIGFQGSCSCPMGYNCKHVVALLLADLDHYQHAMARSPAPRPADRRACTCAGRGGARTATSAAPRRSTTSTPCCAHRRHQATDRAWRIGQQQPVCAYKLIARHAGRKNPGAAVAQGRAGRCGAGQRRGDRTGAGTAGGRPARDLLPGC